MRVAVHGQTAQMSKEEIYKGIENLIDRGAEIFLFFDDSEFDLMTAKAVEEIRVKKGVEIYTLLHITDRNREFNKSNFDFWLQYAPIADIPQAVIETTNNSDFVFPEKVL